MLRLKGLKQYSIYRTPENYFFCARFTMLDPTASCYALFIYFASLTDWFTLQRFSVKSTTLSARRKTKIYG